MGGDDGRRQRTRLLQKHLLNPPMKAAAHLGLLPGHLLLETRGRRSGKRRVVVVGHYEEAGAIWVVAEQGRHAGYVRNLEADGRVRVRLRRRWVPATARVVDDDDPLQRLASFRRRGHQRIVTAVGTSLLTVRIDLDDAGLG